MLVVGVNIGFLVTVAVMLIMELCEMKVMSRVSVFKMIR